VGSVQQHREANSPQLASPFSWRSSKQIRRCYKLTDEITSQSPGFSRPLRKLSQPPTPLSPAHGSQTSDDTPGKVVTGRMIREFSLPHGDGRWGEPPWARLSIFPVVSIPPPPTRYSLWWNRITSRSGTVCIRITVHIYRHILCIFNTENTVKTTSVPPVSAVFTSGLFLQNAVDNNVRDTLNRSRESKTRPTDNLWVMTSNVTDA